MVQDTIKQFEMGSEQYSFAWEHLEHSNYQSETYNVQNSVAHWNQKVQEKQLLVEFDSVIR